MTIAEPPPAHPRAEETFIEAYEYLVRIRGHLEALDGLTREADHRLRDAAQQLRAAGESGIADRLEQEIVESEALSTEWASSIVGDFDRTCFAPATEIERAVRGA
jgi:hypothetical protein